MTGHALLYALKMLALVAVAMTLILMATWMLHDPARREAALPPAPEEAPDQLGCDWLHHRFVTLSEMIAEAPAEPGGLQGRPARLAGLELELQSALESGNVDRDISGAIRALERAVHRYLLASISTQNLDATTGVLREITEAQIAEDLGAASGLASLASQRFARACAAEARRP